MKALSVKQPWAELIAQGIKKIETRTWETNFRGDLLICSGQTPDDWLKPLPEVVHPERGTWCDAPDPGDEEFEYFYHFGKALCLVELFDIIPMGLEHEADAFCSVYPGAFAWHLRNVRRVEPFPVKGQLKLFEVKF